MDGALVVFRLLAPDQRVVVHDEREFLTFIRQAFGAKRKVLTNSLQPKWQRADVAAALAQLGLHEMVRPQTRCAACIRSRAALPEPLVHPSPNVRLVPWSDRPQQFTAG